MHYLLFTTSTCPKCPAFKRQVQLTLEGMEGIIIDEQYAEFEKLAQEYTVGSVPLLLVFDVEACESAVLRTGEVADVLSFAHAHAV